MHFSVALDRSGAPFPRPSDKPSVECKMMPASEDYVPMSMPMSKPGHWDILGSPVVRLCKSLFRRRVYKPLWHLHILRSAAQTPTVSPVRLRGNSPNLSRQTPADFGPVGCGKRVEPSRTDGPSYATRLRLSEGPPDPKAVIADPIPGGDPAACSRAEVPWTAAVPSTAPHDVTTTVAG